MNAYVMAAGNGMRLRPLTENFQKCMLPVIEKPILEWWLDAIFASEKFERVYVNVHHCADQVEAWLTDYLTRKGNYVHIIDERSGLLGTAGTLFWHADPAEEFMSVYADTFSTYFYARIEDAVNRFLSLGRMNVWGGIVTMDHPQDSSAAAVETDIYNMVKSFEEKTDGTRLTWAGILFGTPRLLDAIRKEDRDLAKDVLPRLIGHLKVLMNVEAYDIGRGLDQYANTKKTRRH